MKRSRAIVLFTIVPLTLVALLVLDRTAKSAPTWGISLGDSSLTIDADAYADNGANIFCPLGVCYQQSDVDDISDVQADLVATFFGQPAETYDLGADVFLAGSDRGLNPDFDTSTSVVGVIAIDGVGSRTLDVYFRVNPTAFQTGLGGEGFIVDSMVLLTAQIVATIEGVAPSTPLTIGYEWEYNGAAPVDHEALAEDPTTASGSIGFVDEQGGGPGNLFAELFADPGQIFGNDTGDDSYDLITSNTADPSFVTIDLDGFARTIMNAPGTPIGNPFQTDQAGSTFNGRLTLTLPVPEPSSVALSILAGLSTLLVRARRT
jgi:hypothetical protein